MVMIVAEPHPMTLRTLYLSMGSLTCPVRYRSKTVLCRLLNTALTRFWFPAKNVTGRVRAVTYLYKSA